MSVVSAVTDWLQNTQRETSPEALSERRLLALAGGCVVVNAVSLWLINPERGWLHWLTVMVWMLCAFGGSFALDRLLPRRDPLLFTIPMFLSGWGLLLIDRLAPRFADRQTIWLIISVAAMLAVIALPQSIRWLKAYRYTLLVVGLALLVSTILLGRNPTGDPTAPALWLGAGSVFFQPSEALKIILVAFLASYLAEQYPALRASGLEEQEQLWLSPRILGPVMLMWTLSVVILVWQRDLGTAVLFFMVFLVLLYVASGYTLLIPGGAVLIAIASFAAYRLFGVVQLRVDIWLDPWVVADRSGFQIVQSLLAFAAGGVYGQGIGQGAPTYIPVVHSDFVFAAIAEEWGLLGVIVVITCVATLVTRGLRIAIQQRGRPFHTLLAVGLSTLIATQSLLIMGGVLKLVPLTGVTLPFLSYGGSSLLASFVMIGLLMRLSETEG